MHQALDLIFAFYFDRNHKAPVAHGDDRLLQRLGILRRPDDAIQLFPHLQLGPADAPAQIVKCRGGRIGDLLLRENGIEDILLQPLHGCQHMEQIIGGGRGLALSPPLLYGADGTQHPRHLQYFPSGKPGTQLGPLQGAGAVLYAAQPRRAVPRCQCVDIGGPPQGIAGVPVVITGLQPQRQFLAGRAGRLLRQHFQHPVQLQRPVVFVHFSPSFWSTSSSITAYRAKRSARCPITMPARHRSSISTGVSQA